MSHSAKSKNLRRRGWLNGHTLLLGATFGLAALSQVGLQVVRRENVEKAAENLGKAEKTQTDFAERGRLLTADGKPLAENGNSYLLSISNKTNPRSSAFLIALSEASGIPAVDLEDPNIPTRTFSVPLTAEQRARIRRLARVWRANGVSILPIGNRRYPMGATASGLVGFSRLDRNSKDPKKPIFQRSGLEASMNERLSGTDGVQTGLPDVNGRMLPMRSLKPEVEREDGATIVTTIDSQIQFAASKAIKRAVQQYHAKQGTVIASNPKTGEVYAMASWPADDPASPGKRMGSPNVAAQFLVEPGSTFKILTLAEAIDKGKIAPGSYASCPGYLGFPGGMKISCEDHGGGSAHGDVTPETAISVSCNVAAAKWAALIGFDEFYDFMARLGLDQRSELNLTGESLNMAKKPTGKVWAKGHRLASMGFGQAVVMTPVTLAGAFSAIGNHGVRVPLRLTKMINGRAVESGESKTVFSKEAADYTLHCMEEVVHGVKGTGKNLKIPGHRIAGKTGTAQKIFGGKQIGNVSNFIGMLPAKDPTLQILVVIDTPQGPQVYGGAVAGPVFSEVAKVAIRRLEIPKSE